MVVRIFIFGILLFAALIARDVILLGFFSIVIAMLMSFPINIMSRIIPRSLSVFITLLVMIGVLASIPTVVLPKVSEEVDLLKQEVPMAIKKLQHWISGAEKSAQALSPSPPSSEKTVHPKSEGSVKEHLNSSPGFLSSAAELTTKAFTMVINIVESLSGIVLITILAAFLAADPESYRKGVRIFVPIPYESVFDEAWKRITIGLKHWVGGIFIEMVIMGALAGVGLWIAGIDGALVLGLLTFFATFVPYLGAILSSVPGLLMGLAKSPTHLLYASGIYLAVHIIEGYIVSPYVMKHAIQLRPAVLLFWQALMGALFGIVGIIVATPLLALLKALIGYLYVERYLGKEAPRV